MENSNSTRIFSPLNGEKTISVSKQYFRISKAAEILGCTADDLLHMGAIGKIDIMAPIIKNRLFEWPTGIDGTPFPEIDAPFRVEFGPADRVILSMFDLAQIEGVGSAIPNLFYSPDKARNMIEYEKTWHSETAPQDTETINVSNKKGEIIGTTEFSKFFPPESTTDSNTLRELAFNTPWRSLEGLSSEKENTTIDHLFVSKREIERIISNQPQDIFTLNRNAKEIFNDKNFKHGGCERHAKKREPVLNTAIYCLANLRHQFITTKNGKQIVNAVKFTECIELNIDKFLTDKNEYIISADVITRRLRSILKGDIPD